MQHSLEIIKEKNKLENFLKEKGTAIMASNLFYLYDYKSLKYKSYFRISIMLLSMSNYSVIHELMKEYQSNCSYTVKSIHEKEKLTFIVIE
jgi:hypothetical protein